MSYQIKPAAPVYDTENNSQYERSWERSSRGEYSENTTPSTRIQIRDTFVLRGQEVAAQTYTLPTYSAGIPRGNYEGAAEAKGMDVPIRTLDELA